VSRADGAGHVGDVGGAGAGSGAGAGGGAGDGVGAARAARHAALLLRCYPRAWRERYGDEFAELLIADIEERPRSTTRTLDVARGAIVARFADAGLGGFPLPAATTGDGASAADPHRQVRASLGTLGAALAVCLAFGAAMQSQLTIAWEWSTTGVPSAADPDPPFIPLAGGFATLVTSAAMAAILVLTIAAAIPVIVTVAVRLATGAGRRLALPAGVFAAAFAALFVGGRQFENGWVGTGGHNGLIPGGVAAFEWATSLWVSAYWAHPAALAAFPLAERAWMAVTPLALAALALAAATVVRRAGLSARVLAFEARLATAACAVMTVFLAGVACWVATGGEGAPLFRPGLIDLAAGGALALALAAAVKAARTASRTLRLARPPA
jgi:hypothetical protein